MTEPSIILILCVVITIVVMIALFIGIMTMNSVSQINTKSTYIAPILIKQEKLENAMIALLENSNKQNSMGMFPGPKSFYISANGKYKAETIEALLEQMADGGDLPLPPEEYEKIKGFLETTTKVTQEIEMPWDDEDDDDTGWSENGSF